MKCTFFFTFPQSNLALYFLSQILNGIRCIMPSFHGLVSSQKLVSVILLPYTSHNYNYCCLIGRSLLIANGKQWARARRLLTSAFHFDILRPYFKVYNDAARLLVSKWSRTPERHSFDVYHSLSLLTLDIVLRCACSFESNCQISKYVFVC